MHPLELNGTNLQPELSNVVDMEIAETTRALPLFEEKRATMSGENDLDSTSFNKNYKVLKETADWLSTQKEPDIDQLVPKVEKAMKAYTICKDRLTKVQETLGQYFEKDETEDEAGQARSDGVVKRVMQARPSSDGEDGEHIPF